MDQLERRMIDVDGATLEVFLGGAGEPVVCQSHPFSVLSPDPSAGDNTAWPWEPAMGRFVGVNPRGVGGSSAGRGSHDFTFGQQLDDLEAVRQQLGIARWVFWGSSAG